MRYRKAIRNFVIYVVLVPAWDIVLRLLRIPERLGEDAVVHWLNERIAEKVGIVSPTVEQVSSFLVEWVPPAVLALVCLSGWLVYLRQRWRRPHRLLIVARASEHQPAAAPHLGPALAASKPGPDWPIRELFFHIRPDILDQVKTREWEAVGRDVLARFSTGQLQVWGRQISPPSPRRHPLPLTT